MKIETEQSVILAPSTNTQTESKMATSPKAFMLLSSSLYTNKHKAVNSFNKLFN